MIWPILIALELNTFIKEIKNFIGNKNITANIYRKQAYGSITCEYFFIRFIDTCKDKSLTNFT